MELAAATRAKLISVSEASKHSHPTALLSPGLQEVGLQERSGRVT